MIDEKTEAKPFNKVSVLPSVHWYWWFGARKDICPMKNHIQIIPKVLQNRSRRPTSGDPSDLGTPGKPLLNGHNCSVEATDCCPRYFYCTKCLVDQVVVNQHPNYYTTGNLSPGSCWRRGASVSIALACVCVSFRAEAVHGAECSDTQEWLQ